MSDFAVQILTPTVVAAIVSAGALIARELLAGRFTARQSRDEQHLRRQGVLMEQVRLLWTENAALRRREADCERRHRMLARRCEPSFPGCSSSNSNRCSPRSGA